MKMSDLKLEDAVLTDGNIADWVDSLEKVWSVYAAGMAVCRTFENDDIWQSGNTAYVALCQMIVDYVQQLPDRYRWTIVSMWCADGISVERYHKAIMLDDCFDTIETDGDERIHTMALYCRHALD